jgi:hypothetical protein
MQTFLPYKSFEESANVLDKKRCWKQVVETAQIISVLEGKTTAWQNHPAVQMWVWYTPALKYYFNCFLEVCLLKHKINTKYEMFDLPKIIRFPWWLGNGVFHRAMRARLIEKDESFYLPLFPNDKDFNDGKYAWPVSDGKIKKFKII